MGYKKIGGLSLPELQDGLKDLDINSLTVNDVKTETLIDAENLIVNDNALYLNDGQASGLLDGSIVNLRGSNPDTSIKYNETEDNWQLTNDGTNFGSISLKDSTILKVSSSGLQDYTSIQDAINNASEGSVVQVYPGTYNENITLKPNVSIIGSGRNNTKIQASSGNLLYCNQSGQTQIENISLILNASNSTDTLINLENLRTRFLNCALILNVSTAIKPKFINLLNAHFNSIQDNLVYNQTYTGVNGDYDICDISGDSQLVISDNSLVVNIAQNDGEINFIRDNSSALVVIGTATCILNFNNSFNGKFRILDNVLSAPNVAKQITTNYIQISGDFTGEVELVKCSAIGGESVYVFSSTTVEKPDNLPPERFVTCNAVGTNLIRFIFTDCPTCNFIGNVDKTYSNGSGFRTNQSFIVESLLLNNVDNSEPEKYTLEDIISQSLCAGWTSGATLINNGDGTVSTNSGTGFIRDLDNDTAHIFSFDIPETLNISLTDNFANYIYVDYNGGTPAVISTTDPSSLRENQNNAFELYKVVREGTSLTINDSRQVSNNIGGKAQVYLERLNEIVRLARRGELVLSDIGNRNLSLSAGKIFTKLNETSISALDTSISDTFDMYYRDGVGGWIKQTGLTQFPTTLYDDNSGVLKTVTDNYSYIDFFIDTEGRLVGAYGREETYFREQSEGAESPLETILDLPTRLKETGIFIARLIFEPNGTEATDIRSAFDPSYNPLAIRKDVRQAGLSDSLSYQRQEFTIVEDSGNLYVDVQAIGGGDITYVFRQKEYILNCTTGSGVDGKARIQIQEGASSATRQENWVYVIPQPDGSAILQNTTSRLSQTLEFCYVCKVVVPDSVAFISEGAWLSRRYTQAKEHDSKSILFYHSDKLRSLGSTWLSGVQPTCIIDDTPSPDQVGFTVSSGWIKQIRDQLFPALDIETDGIYVANASGLGTLTQNQKLTNLAEALEDSQGNSLEDSKYNLIIFGTVNHETSQCKLWVNLPNGNYAGTGTFTPDAYNDSEQTSVVSVPVELKDTAFLIARVPLEANNNGTIFNFINPVSKPEIISLLGNPAGVSGSGANGSAVTFNDSDFEVFNLDDNTKRAKLDVSNVSTATQISLEVPNEDGKIVIEDVNGIAGASILSVNDAQIQYSTGAGEYKFLQPDGTTDAGLMSGSGNFINAIFLNGNSINSGGLSNVAYLDRDNTYTNSSNYTLKEFYMRGQGFFTGSSADTNKYKKFAEINFSNRYEGCSFKIQLHSSASYQHFSGYIGELSIKAKQEDSMTNDPIVKILVEKSNTLETSDFVAVCTNKTINNTQIKIFMKTKYEYMNTYFPLQVGKSPEFFDIDLSEALTTTLPAGTQFASEYMDIVGGSLRLDGSIQQSSTEYQYWGDPNTDGSIRLFTDSGQLKAQKRANGIWGDTQTLTNFI